MNYTNYKRKELFKKLTGISYAQHLNIRVCQYLTYEFFLSSRAVAGHSPPVWQSTNRPFVLCFLDATALIRADEMGQAMRNGFLFIAQAITSCRRLSLLVVSGLPEGDPYTLFRLNRTLLRSIGHGYSIRWTRGYLTNLPLLILEYWNRPTRVLRRLHSKAQRALFLENRRGIRLLTRFPDVACFFSVSGIYETAFQESLALRIATVAFVDTDREVAPTLACVPCDDDILKSLFVRGRLLKELVVRSLKQALFAEISQFEVQVAHVPTQLRFAEMREHLGQVVPELPALLEKEQTDQIVQLRADFGAWVKQLGAVATSCLLHLPLENVKSRSWGWFEHFKARIRNTPRRFISMDNQRLHCVRDLFLLCKKAVIKARLVRRSYPLFSYKRRLWTAYLQQVIRRIQTLYTQVWKLHSLRRQQLWLSFTQKTDVLTPEGDGGEMLVTSVLFLLIRKLTMCLYSRLLLLRTPRLPLFSFSPQDHRDKDFFRVDAFGGGTTTVTPLTCFTYGKVVGVCSYAYLLANARL